LILFLGSSVGRAVDC